MDPRVKAKVEETQAACRCYRRAAASFTETLDRLDTLAALLASQGEETLALGDHAEQMLPKLEETSAALEKEIHRLALKFREAFPLPP